MFGISWGAVALGLAVQAAASAVAVLAPPAATAGVAPSLLPAGTPVHVALDQDLSTATSIVGDVFAVTVTEDVRVADRVVVPAGSRGRGMVTFVTRKGGFGKAGIIGIALRSLTVGGRTIVLDGRYREEGRGNGGAVAATWMVAGIQSGVIKGRDVAIPKGRVLKARTGEDLAYAPAAAAIVVDAIEQD